MDKHDKPNSQAAGWQRLSTDYPYQGHFIHLRRDRVRVRGVHEFDFAYIESKGAVWVVPVTGDGQIVLIRQYRYAIDEWVWEVPAGGLFDHDGDPESLARRELREEVGGEAEQFQYLGWYYGGVAITDSKCHVFLAHNTRLAHAPQHELAETIELHPVSIAEALNLARTGAMRDGRSALALLWSEPHLKRDT
ncbi:MAG TPA: NUDIX hydrolase [Anaerolineae bacterium]|nr:NUDIX hydrolase [Anaerolineae bacterium]